MRLATKRNGDSPLSLLLLLVLIAPGQGTAVCATRLGEIRIRPSLRFCRAADTARAERAFQSLSNADPKGPNLANAIAAALSAAGKQQRRGDLVAAERALRRAMSLNPGDASVYYLLAGVLQKLAKTEEAAAEFRLTKEVKSEERQRKVLRTRLIRPKKLPDGWTARPARDDKRTPIPTGVG